VAHGTPDYGVTAGSLTRYQMLDLGELAARLGSPDTHDRRGDVVWWDDAECGLAKWTNTPVGVNASFGLDTTRARNGRNSYKLRPGDAANDTISATHEQPISHMSRYGFEFSFSVDPNASVIQWWHRHFDGANLTDLIVEWKSSTNELACWIPPGVFLVFASGVFVFSHATLFNTGKMVVNAETMRYERFILNNVVYDLDQQSGVSAASALAPHHELIIRVFNVTGAAPTVWVDDIILTENEPANP